MNDYHLLLKKYMRHILECESTTFVGHIETGDSEVEFTEYEKALLEQVRDEVLEELSQTQKS